jgi:hypothetical protein
MAEQCYLAGWKHIFVSPLRLSQKTKHLLDESKTWATPLAYRPHYYAYQHLHRSRWALVRHGQDYDYRDWFVYRKYDCAIFGLQPLDFREDEDNS